MLNHYPRKELHNLNEYKQVNIMRAFATTRMRQDDALYNGSFGTPGALQSDPQN